MYHTRSGRFIRFSPTNRWVANASQVHIFQCWNPTTSNSMIAYFYLRRFRQSLRHTLIRLRSCPHLSVPGTMCICSDCCRNRCMWNRHIRSNYRETTWNEECDAKLTLRIQIKCMLTLTGSLRRPCSGNSVCIYSTINTATCTQQCNWMWRHFLLSECLPPNPDQLSLWNEWWTVEWNAIDHCTFRSHFLRRIYLYSFSFIFPPKSVASKSTGNVRTVHLSSSSSCSSVNALNRPGTPSKSSTCDFFDKPLRVSFVFGHMSTKKREITVENDFSLGSVIDPQNFT